MKLTNRQISVLLITFGTTFSVVIITALLLYFSKVNGRWIFFIVFMEMCIPFILLYWGYTLSKRKYLKSGPERFYAMDIIYYAGSSIRPHVPGVLKNNEEEKIWFIVYDDGFEEFIKDESLVIKWKKSY